MSGGHGQVDEDWEEPCPADHEVQGKHLFEGDQQEWEESNTCTLQRRTPPPGTQAHVQEDPPQILEQDAYGLQEELSRADQPQQENDRQQSTSHVPAQDEIHTPLPEGFPTHPYLLSQLLVGKMSQDESDTPHHQSADLSEHRDESDIQLVAMGAPSSLAEAGEEIPSAGDQDLQTVFPPPPYPADALGDDIPAFQLNQTQRTLSIQEPPRYEACVPHAQVCMQNVPPAYFQEQEGMEQGGVLHEQPQMRNRRLPEYAHEALTFAVAGMLVFFFLGCWWSLLCSVAGIVLATNAAIVGKRGNTRAAKIRAKISNGCTVLGCVSAVAGSVLATLAIITVVIGNALKGLGQLSMEPTA